MIKAARDRLHEAIWESLDSLLARWAQANGLTLDEREREKALEKLMEAVR